MPARDSTTDGRFGAGNADPAELAKFSALAHRWWDPGSEFKPLHDINPLRVGWVERIAGGVEGKRVADVGCGGGIFAEALAQRGADVTGIDLSEKAIAVARLHQYESGTSVDYRRVAAETLALEMPGAFDVVTCLELLEHVPEPASTVAACSALARPGGTVVFSTINRNPKSYAQAILAAEYVLKLLPRGTHDWARFLRPSEVAAFGRRARLDLIAMTGMTYNPLTQVYRLTDDTSVNYLAAFRRTERDAG
ncbi:MAG TPA: bifunctional 2-polyprenyl-6-hydroxyphenol methylase/3-demethylubiquinol 3-O-methyltransferase UbiG [Casimicrobiaceae bacterium]|jgi:2-polyprenyl-6-hydroxyphenyl methylase/3-demethylubiquinone-9 3-methyltransferase|nr:bifunctional 2-polyprenyl-6-hydroxyphenol methylase/3-demethylubiquinol 3-O-methyltransferase UbiG [Casimicrobiaceae bacterium]